MTLRLMVLAIVLLPQSVLACSSAVAPPARVDANLIAFTGIVVAHPTAARPLFGVDGAPGLRVRVVEPLLFPAAEAVVEVYLFGSAPDCTPVAREMADLKEQYPEGATVTVVARAAVEGEADDNTSQIVSLADDFGHVAVEPCSPPRTPDGTLDFAAFGREYEVQPEDGFDLALAWRNAHRSWFEDFEYLRALTLLPRLPDDRKMAVLGNIRSYSRLRGTGSQLARSIYQALVHNAGLPPSLERRLLVLGDSL